MRKVITLRAERFAYLSICLSAYLIICLFVSPNPSFAEGASLSIYPPVIEVQTTPPSSPAVPIAIQNNNNEDITLKIQLIPLRANNAGEVQLRPDEASKGLYPYFKDKIQFLIDGKKTDIVKLQALETKEVDLNINLAQGDPPGDYYYTIVFLSSGSGPINSSVSQIPTGIATNLLLSIGPKDGASGDISQFTTSLFKDRGPVDFTLKLHNSSKHLVAPTGIIEITNFFGKKVGSVKILPQYVLADSDRYLQDDSQGSQLEKAGASPRVIWSEKFLIGWYKATAKVNLEDKGQSLVSSAYFVAFPFYFFFPLVIIIFVVLSIYLRVKRKI